MLSQFCIGLQLADYAAYWVSLKTQQISKKTGESEIINTQIKSQVPVQNSEENRKNRKAELLGAFDILKAKIHLVEISHAD